MTALKILTGLQGKKLLWTGFDPESDMFLMLFEDKTVVSVSAEGIIFPTDSAGMLKAFQKDYGVFSEQVVALDSVLNPNQEKSNPEVLIAPLLTEADMERIRESIFAAMQDSKKREGPMGTLTKEAVLGGAGSFQDVVTKVVDIPVLEDGEPIAYFPPVASAAEALDEPV